MEEEIKEVDWAGKWAFREGDEKFLWMFTYEQMSLPFTPMAATMWLSSGGPRGLVYAYDLLSFPPIGGCLSKLYRGIHYSTMIPVTDPEEIKERAIKFQEKMPPMIKEYPKFYAETVDEWQKGLKYLADIDSRKETLSLKELLDALKEADGIYKRSFELHMVAMSIVLFAQFPFEGLCQQYGIDVNDVPKLLQGFPTNMTKCDGWMWRLANLAQELGLSDIFTRTEKVETLPDELSKTDHGRKWLKEFNKFLAVFGKRTTTPTNYEFYYPTWSEEPAPALSTIKSYILTGKFDFEAQQRKIVGERESFIKETLAKIKTEEERQGFREALKTAQDTFPFFEDHPFYVEQGLYGELRYLLLECGRRLVNYGIIEDPSDVNFLTFEELVRQLEELIFREVVKLQAKHYLPLMIRDRKQVWKELHKVVPSRFIGTIPEIEIEDPLYIKFWGVTDDVIHGRIKAPEAKDLIGGYAGVPGLPRAMQGSPSTKRTLTR